MSYKLIMLPNPVLVSDEKINPTEPYVNNGVVFYADSVFDEGNNPNNSNPIITDHNFKIIAGIEGLPSLDLSAIAEEIGWGGIWALGNKISVTTLYDYEERKEFPNHNEYENFGKRTYIGEVIEVDKGLALKTDDGKIFKTQGTYWFGSILHQDCKLLEVSQSLNEKKYSEEDMIEFAKYHEEYCRMISKQKWEEAKASLKQFLQMWLLKRKHKEYNVEVEMDHCENCGDDGVYIDNDSNRVSCEVHAVHTKSKPKITDNTIKVLRVIN